MKAMKQLTFMFMSMPLLMSIQGHGQGHEQGHGQEHGEGNGHQIGHGHRQ
jgi:hypothetical protein